MTPPPRRRLPVSLLVPLLVGAAAAAAFAVFPLPAGAQEEPGPPGSVAPAAAEQPAPIVRAVRIEGARNIPEKTLAEAVTGVAAGRPGDRETIRLAVEAVVDVYRKQGFPVAQVVETSLEADGTLRLTVAEGTIRSIIIRGNSKTRESTIREALTTRPGEVYQESRVRADRDRLARLGIFEDVVVRPVSAGTVEDEESERAAGSDEREEDDEGKGKRKPAPDEAPPVEDAADDAAALDVGNQVGLVDLVVRVRERRTGNIAAAVGFADNTGLVGFLDLSEDNLAGTARRMSVQWQRTSRVEFSDIRREYVTTGARMAYRMSYSAPALGPGDISYGLDLYNQNTIFLPYFIGTDDTLRQYEQRRGGTVRVGRALRPGLSVNLLARRDEVGYDPVPVRLNPPLGALRESFGTVAALGAELVADARDAADNPRRGYRWSVAHEQAGRLLGGDRVFNTTVADLRQYAPIAAVGDRRNGPVVLALRALGGVSTGDVPLSEQFWIGGFDLLRGYDLFSIRGTRMLLTSVEARVPIGQGVQGVLFADYGNAWQPGRRVSLTDMKAGVGAGMRFLTPIGPIRLDIAYGSGLKTYVSLGQAY